MRDTNESIKGYSSLPGHEHKSEAVAAAGESRNAAILNTLSTTSAALSAALLLRLFAAGIKAQQAGNCFEFALYCHSLLTKKGIPSELFRINGGDHVFLIINRNKDLPVSDFKNWNKDALLVDPFFSKVYMAHELLGSLKSCVYDKDSHKVSYFDFNPETQQLDNGVMENLVKDWTLLRETLFYFFLPFSFFSI